MRDYARLQTAILLRRFAFQVTRITSSADPDCVHDLRVAIRRFSRCLRVFAEFYPGNACKKIRRELSAILHLAGEVRDRDIAMEFLTDAGIPKGAHIRARLQTERRKAARDLQAEARRWKAGSTSRKWRAKLEL